MADLMIMMEVLNLSTSLYIYAVILCLQRFTRPGQRMPMEETQSASHRLHMQASGSNLDEIN
jgi:hypothetical protein